MLRSLLFACFAVFCTAVAVPAAQAQLISERPLEQVPRSSAYIADSLKLSGVLGAAHAIRIVCSGQSDQFWRVYMQELLDIEAPQRGTQLRSSMARAFNNAYSREANAGRVCDQDTINREGYLAAQGRLLAEGLATYYFPRPTSAYEE